MSSKFEYKLGRIDDTDAKFEITYQSPHLRDIRNANFEIFQASNGWKILSVDVPEVDPELKYIYKRKRPELR